MAFSQSFSTEATEFIAQAKSSLSNSNVPTHALIASDFEALWSTQLTSSQKQQIIKISQKIISKGYGISTANGFFAALTAACTIEKVSSESLDKILEVSEQAAHSFSRPEFLGYLNQIHSLFSTRFLYNSRNYAYQIPLGSLNFEYNGVMIELPKVEEEINEADILAQELSVIVTETPTTDPWANDDPWATASPWDNPDPWNTANNETFNDPWAVNDAAEVTNNEPKRKEAISTLTSYATQVKARYLQPDTVGALMKISNGVIKLGTKIDTLSLSEVDGAYLFQRRLFAGTKATLNWPEKHVQFKDGVISLGEFTLSMSRDGFITPHAFLELPSLFSGKSEGNLIFQGSAGNPQSPNEILQFTSFESTLFFQLDSGSITYRGGIQLTNSKLSGRALDKTDGELTLLDGKGRTIIFRGELFEFTDSLIKSNNTSITILHDFDSIYHPSVQMTFDRNKKYLVAYRTKAENASPFYSTYFNVAAQVDLIKWDFNADSVNLDILTGKDLVPAVFESFDYFSPLRYSKLAGPFGFHPISISVFYARKYGLSSFFDQELINEFKLNDKMVKGAMKMLHQYHLAEYNTLTGEVKLHDRAFHYYDAAAKKKDFDNVLIASKIGGLPNATWRLLENEILVRGVDRFYLTYDFKISAEPRNKEVILQKNRMVKFDGVLEAGDFDYAGHDYLFDYDAFLINMVSIDSIRILIKRGENADKTDDDALANQLKESSGTLFLDLPTNRSGREKTGRYPYYVSDSEAAVYFDGPEVLGGAYDKSVRFIIPPTEVDSINRGDATTISFGGIFNSGGIFPTFEDTLRILPDQSMGFTHDIPDEGYNLYGTPARTYEKILLNSQGMRGFGKIDFLNTTVFSEDFIYYPDSVTANGYFGTIKPGPIGEGSFPQAELGAFRMYWLPRKDSMYLKTLDEPFKFYDNTAELIGEANITQKGVYGSGSLLTRGSLASSREFNFSEFNYSAKHAKFEVLSDDPDKPAMFGEDIRLSFDLVKNIADVHPEKIGVAAISFPYAAMKTSITNAEWYLVDSLITMTKPEEIPIEDSYFYTTRQDLDSLAFNASKATYDIRTYKLAVEGIPFINVADAKIIPEGNKTTILANADLQVFTNAELIFEYPNAKHYLSKGVIDVESSKQFSGKASYLLPILQDTFEIELGNFYQEERFVSKGKSTFSTKATGEISETKKIDIAPGFLYKGGVTLKVYKQALELDGYVKPDFKNQPGHNFWISYSRTEDQTRISVPIDKAKYENGDAIVAGIHVGLDKSLYSTFIERHRVPGDHDFFLAKGNLTYQPETKTYEIEHPAKARGESYEGHTMIFSDSTGSIVFEGLVNFMELDNSISVKSSAIGYGNKSSNEYSLDGLFTFDLKLAPTILAKMSIDITDVVSRLGNAPANNIEIETLIKLANVVGEAVTRNYEKSSLQSYVSMANVSTELNKSIVISSAKLVWNNERRAWYNTTKLGLSNILRDDINALVDGFLEFTKDDAGGDVMNLFIQAAPGSWYYFNYQENSLLVYSSNRPLNQEIAEKSNFGKSKPGEMVLIAGDENETLKFLNAFRKNYFGIDEPYNLLYPDDASLEDEQFKTIEKKDDDGFGF